MKDSKEVLQTNKEGMDPTEERFHKRKDWIKNIAIIFLVIMLLLTFFSNTIMNYSLPEVAVQYVTNGNITTKVRGTGTVESADPYNVMVKQSRKVASVSVKAGVHVTKGDLLFTLDEADSTELEEALAALEDAQSAYETALLQAEITQSTISDSLAGLTVGDYRNQIAALQKEAKAAENAYNAASQKVNELGNKSTIAGAEYVDISEETQNYNNALTAYEGVSLEYANASANVSRLADEVASLTSIVSTISGLSQSLNNAATTYEEAKKNAKTPEDVIAAQTEYENRKNLYEAYVISKQLEAENNGTVYNASEDLNARDLKANMDEGEAYWQRIVAERAIYDNAASDYATTAASIQGQIDYYNALAGGDASQALTMRTAEYQEAVNSANYKQAEVKAAENNMTAAKNALDKKNRDNDNSLEKASLQLQSAYASVDKTNAELALERANTKLSDKVKDINNQLGLTSLYSKVEKAQEKVDKLSGAESASEITAPISGTILTVNVTSGKETNPDIATVEIQPEGQGFTCSFTVSNEQAKAISVGDSADLVNSWWYNNVTAKVASIVPDKTSPNQNKLVTFNLDGDLTSGQSLSLSVGSKTANYDLIVPTSSIREDNNGKFILVVVSKSSPLGNRYIATRYDVEVLASDDTQSAISAGLSGYEYVITTSTKPISAGEQVRLANQ